MKKSWRITIVIISSLLLILAGFGIYLIHPVDANIICDGVLELDTITKDVSIVSNTGLKQLWGHYSPNGQCNAAVKTLANGDTIVGRNFDMTLSHSPIYIGSTNIEGYYPTVYAANMDSYGPDYERCAKKGVPWYIRAIVPYVAADSMNSEGLYMEINMRTNQKDENGNFVFSCSGTNSDSNTRVCVYELPTYVTLRCKNVNEALALINTLDVYTPNDGENWSLCISIADAEGNYGLIEFGCNEIRWLPGQAIQTNFYISEDWNQLQLYKQGIGRYEYIEEHLDDVETEEDMLSLMGDLKYSQIYNTTNANFDIRSEYTGEADYLTNDYVDNDDNWNALLKECEEELDLYHSMSTEEKKDAGIFWESLYTSIANCSQKTLSLSFFEEYQITYTMHF